ncbi:MAG: Transcription antitermination protein NusG [uncultured Campylobacterales bacterium]|uniref:Transcription termination/antitermination protein NusG n=1 Tax=uncultured Campylobacterales bacterium TaxID=352960 RepID=A0A6S6SSN1_9BACT|nr:MAG: Transcription antitermination protein NusG [uncultured Campylobacterales bacterium]
MSYNWYAIQTYVSSEQSVKKAIENIFEANKIEEKLKEVLVPTEDLIDVKNGKKKIVQRSLYPGYVFAHLDLDMMTWHMIQSLPKVGRFIGESKKPTPLSQKDIDLIIEKVNQKEAPRPKVFFEKGESVRITEGAFANFNGVVEEYDVEHGKLRLNVSIFGRSTPVEILYNEVEKIV